MSISFPFIQIKPFQLSNRTFDNPMAAKGLSAQRIPMRPTRMVSARAQEDVLSDRTAFSNQSLPLVQQIADNVTKLDLFDARYLEKLGLSTEEFKAELEKLAEPNNAYQKASQALQNASRLNAKPQLKQLQAAFSNLLKAAEQYPYYIQKSICYQNAVSVARLLNKAPAEVEKLEKLAEISLIKSNKQSQKLLQESEIQADFSQNFWESAHDTLRFIAGGFGSMYAVVKNDILGRGKTSNGSEYLEHARMLFPMPKFQKTVIAHYLKTLSLQSHKTL